MIELIKEFSEKNNILYGVCGVKMRQELKGALLNVKTPFVAFENDYRLDPLKTLPNAKSIIVIGVPYKKMDTAVNIAGKVKISMNAAEIDYHTQVMEVLKSLDEYLKKEFDFESFLSADTGPLIERELAVMSGIGYYGKNGCVINETYGSLFNIGYIITDKLIEHTKSNIGENICGSCKKCIDGCINGALSESGFDYVKCVSSLTQSKTEEVFDKKTLNGYIYGCDICQLLCPYNDKLPTHDNSCCYYDRDYILSLSNREFREKFKDTGIYWRGNAIIKRNV